MVRKTSHDESNFVPCSGGIGDKSAHDGVDMDTRAVKMWEVGIFGTEDKRKIRAGKEYRVQTFAMNERVRQNPQVLVVMLRGVLILHDPEIGVGYQIDLCRAWAHDLHILESPEQVSFHGDACPKDRETLKVAPLDFGDDSIEETHERNRSDLRQLLRTNLR